MKNSYLLILCILSVSCENKKIEANKEVLNIDSINNIRQKYNDSIAVLNAKNKQADWSGTHQLKHNMISGTGKILFKNIGRDLYQVSGNLSAGQDYLKINGEIKVVSDEYLNFSGTVVQSIAENDGGKIDKRTKKTSFARKGMAPYWRFQNKINSAGFADEIDIYK